MKKKILLVLTGGTICSIAKSSNEAEFNGIFINKLNSEKACLQLLGYLREDYPEYNEIEFEQEQPMDTFSESMTLERWNELILFLRKVDWQAYCGLILLHGTDTLAYTSSLLSMLLVGVSKPVFLVSSNAPVEKGKDRKFSSNGLENFKAAVDLIHRGIAPDVYVTYRNIEDLVMYIHRGAHLKQCENESHNFYSKTKVRISDITDKHPIQFGKDSPREVSQDYSMLIKKLRPLKNRILYIIPYVGMSYAGLNLKDFAAVLHRTYHSGTACVVRTEKESQYKEDSILYLLDRCSDEGIKVWCTPFANPEKEEPVYSTVPIMLNHDVEGKKDKGVKALYGMTDECAYAKLLISHNMDMEEEERERFMRKSVNAEMR